MEKHLEFNNKNQKYINSLKKVYLIGCWARYGIMEFPFTGEFVEDELFGMTPLVYDFDDHNGTYDEWVLRKIQNTTTGQVIMYCFNKELAQRYADNLQRLYEYDRAKRKEELDKIDIKDIFNKVQVAYDEATDKLNKKEK